MEVPDDRTFRGSSGDVLGTSRASWEGLICTYLTGIWALGKFGGNWAHIPPNDTSLFCKITWRLSYTCFIGIWGRLWGKWIRILPNHLQGHLKSNPKSFPKSAPHFTLSEALLYVKNLCGSSYACFTGSRVLGQFKKTGPEYPQIMSMVTGEVIESLQVHISH